MNGPHELKARNNVCDQQVGKSQLRSSSLAARHVNFTPAEHGFSILCISAKTFLRNVLVTLMREGLKVPNWSFGDMRLNCGCSELDVVTKLYELNDRKKQDVVYKIVKE